MAGLVCPGRRPAFIEGLAQLREAVRQDAGDLHLGNADGIGDLLLRLILIEAQVQNVALSLRQSLQSGGQREGVDGETQRAVLGPDQGDEGRAVTVVRFGVEVLRAALAYRTQCRDDEGQAQAGVFCDLLRGGSLPAMPLFEFPDGLEDLAACLLDGPGQPHQHGPVP